jgi:hypothetical protein
MLGHTATSSTYVTVYCNEDDARPIYIAPCDYNTSCLLVIIDTSRLLVVIENEGRQRKGVRSTTKGKSGSGNTLSEHRALSRSAFDLSSNL